MGISKFLLSGCCVHQGSTQQETNVGIIIIIIIIIKLSKKKKIV